MKSEYNAEIHPFLAGAYARAGLIDKDIAKMLGINVATLYRWKLSHCEFCDALKVNKVVIDYHVESALLKRALGYEITETKIIKDKDEKVIKTEITTKQILPDVGACTMWLKNRDKEHWRDNPEKESENSEGTLHLLVESLNNASKANNRN
ncbi:MAG: hypothetical protein A2287_04350 [Candidatus Melainabacteria bacterium RIFOXYA12_FULL_32_12]|nr:MAG: hypothetical protein A2287_04350 [Candidatus Melainabacteria bacterium RIFOXYA12_FULL_32_12]